MTASPENYAPDRRNGRHLLQTLWPWLIELWIAAVLVAFFIVRILGSSTGKRILDSFWHPHS